MREISSIQTDHPDVVKAYGTVSTCLARRGVRADGEQAFFAVLADSSGRTHAGPRAVTPRARSGPGWNGRTTQAAAFGTAKAGR